MADFALSTSKGDLTEAGALEIELDVLPTLRSQRHVNEFKHDCLYSRKSQIEELISRHLGIPLSDFALDEPQDWIHGSFNLCLAMDISARHSARLPRTAVIRFPIPITAGEHSDPEFVDEKLRCEAATYIWLQKYCPTIPTPRLLGMGLPGRQSFTAIANESLPHWCIWQLRRGLAWLCGSTLSPYFAHPRKNLTDVGYLLLEWVEDGKMLSSSWQKHRHDERRRNNLYRDMTKIMLSLASIPLPRIGSWTMDDKGIISLTNRPLVDLTGFWNKNNVPTNVPRKSTYDSSEAFVQDLLAYQDSRMRHQPNSILSKRDGIYQLSALVGLRALLPYFWNQKQRNGPFVLALPDMHQSNVFVDDEWNIVSVIDFEFAPVMPLGMTCVPSWLTDRGVDQFEGQDLEEYRQCYEAFADVMEQEENLQGRHNSYSQQLRKDWQTGGFWYITALNSLNGFPAIFQQHIQPKFFEAGFELDGDGAVLSRLWCHDVDGFIAKKLEDNEQYKSEVREIFAAARSREPRADDTTTTTESVEIKDEVSVNSNPIKA